MHNEDACLCIVMYIPRTPNTFMPKNTPKKCVYAYDDAPTLRNRLRSTETEVGSISQAVAVVMTIVMRPGLN